LPTKTTQPADASPEKRLFVFLLTRDISLADAFLDLIDNSINSAIVTRNIKLDTPQDYVELLQLTRHRKLPHIKISLSPDLIEVRDDAGGISFDNALRDVFRFGRGEEEEFAPTLDRLSVYGIGLKRATFKMGNRIDITSNHPDTGFVTHLNVSKWQKDTAAKWSIPISRHKVANDAFGTTVKISELRADVRQRIEDPAFSGELIERIQKTYIYFLNTIVTISVTEESASRDIESVDLGVGENFSNDSFEEYGVACRITAGIARTSGHFAGATAGWYVFCNGRAVTYADKTELTGWDGVLLPLFQPKHRPFLGLVFFVSRNPELLPWTTTKTHINQESLIWQSAKRRMSVVGRNVTSFLDKRHRGGPGCLNRFSASIGGAPAGVRLPSGEAAA